MNACQNKYNPPKIALFFVEKVSKYTAHLISCLFHCIHKYLNKGSCYCSPFVFFLAGWRKKKFYIQVCTKCLCVYACTLERAQRRFLLLHFYTVYTFHSLCISEDTNVLLSSWDNTEKGQWWHMFEQYSAFRPFYTRLTMKCDRAYNFIREGYCFLIADWDWK